MKIYDMYKQTEPPTRWLHTSICCNYLCLGCHIGSIYFQDDANLWVMASIFKLIVEIDRQGIADVVRNPDITLVNTDNPTQIADCFWSKQERSYIFAIQFSYIPRRNIQKQIYSVHPKHLPMELGNLGLCYWFSVFVVVWVQRYVLRNETKTRP